jgi:hypothetical protein
MDTLWIKKGNSLVPADVVSEEMLHEIKDGQFVTTSRPKRRRNPSFHALMMLMLQKTMEATRPRFHDLEDLMDFLKLKSGMVKEIEVGRGKVKLKFKSVSFASMDEVHFRRVADRWRYIIAEEFGFDAEDLLPPRDREAA